MRILVNRVVLDYIKIGFKIIFDLFCPLPKGPNILVPILLFRDCFVTVVPIFIFVAEPFEASEAQSDKLDSATIL